MLVADSPASLPHESFLPPNTLLPVLGAVEGAPPNVSAGFVPPNVNAGFVVGEADVVRANKLLGAVEGAPPNVKAGFVVGEVDVAGVPPPNALPPVLDGLEGAPPNVKAGFVVGEVDAAGLPPPRRFAPARFFFCEFFIPAGFVT